MTREYEVTQLTEGVDDYDLYYPLNGKPSISDDGRRVVFPSRHPGPRGSRERFIVLYDRDRGEERARPIMVRVGGDERYLGPGQPQISGNGEKIVFHSSYDYIGDGKSGIYVYDIDEETIHRVFTDKIPRYPSGVAKQGEPGMTKYETRSPSISADGSWLAYYLIDFEYAGWSTWDHWRSTRCRLCIAQIDGDRISSGDDILEAHGGCPPRISGDGQTICFYATGLVEGLEVENLEMPPFEGVIYPPGRTPTFDFYCYVVIMDRPGRYRLKAVPDPAFPTEPLVVANPCAANVQSFTMASVLDRPCPPSICHDGSKVALNGRFVMGDEETGVYLYDPIDNFTRKIISFGARPGSVEEPRLVTGAAPAISAEGDCLAYYLREVGFPEGYSDPSSWEDDRTHCPTVYKDEVVVHELRGDRSNLIETAADPVQPHCTALMGLDIARDGSHVAFISCADKVGENPDRSHEMYYARRKVYGVAPGSAPRP